MAEAMVVEERTATPKRFFCHMCNVEINIPNTDYTCPLCSNGFVEELPANAPELSASTSNSASISDAGNIGTSFSPGGSGILNVESLRNDIVSLLSMRNVPNLEITIEPNRRHVLGLGSGGGAATPGSNIGGGRVRPANLDRLDNVLYDFLQSLPLSGATAEIVAGPGGSVGTGNSHMFFMGNPGDYAWGREGLDTIVTQMLNQMETSGPPPLSTQRINEIPNVKISAEEVERKMQCSVCWDDFKLDESVRKLPCSHLYHENCIVPWLNLHSTCPICRKSLANDDDTEGTDEDYVWLNNMVETANRSRAQSAQSNTSSQTTTTTTAAAAAPAAASQSATAAAPNQLNNVFTFDEDNMNLD
ncbi:CG11982 [Drosophila busckii]|uniref:RING-type E3 ubiquitin transferase n=1 Tax=Drosophila busckii TaxID=30019 RepID=A0A0M4EQ83_DROBS|nr:E3 ubiquitin-protein ligase Iruka [Drosophila busckii]XP_017845440.1 E3 ubiquitin-protein ligase Iruka [Drosophila busckii]ALC47114.1 CG11982 [Drosophila busckii]